MRKFIAAYLIANVIMALVGTAVIMSAKANADTIQQYNSEALYEAERALEENDNTKRHTLITTPKKRF